MAQLEIKARHRLTDRHPANRLASDHPLADGAVDSIEPCHQRMIAIAVTDDQDLAVTLEGASENDSSVERRNDLGAGPSREGDTLRVAIA